MAKKSAAVATQTAKNQAVRLNRHLKRHPNDAQSAKAVGKPRTARKAPYVKGSFRKVNKAYRDEAGHVLEAPRFAPVVKQAK